MKALVCRLLGLSTHDHDREVGALEKKFDWYQRVDYLYP